VNLWSRLRSWLLATLGRSRLEREMEAEFQQHMEQQAEDLIRNGVPREEARRRARRAFGGLDQTREACRDARGAGSLEALLGDFAFGVRILRKNPGFSALAVTTLALGIGATTATFGLVNAVLLRQLPYRDSQRLVFLWEPNPSIPGVPLEAWGPLNGDFYDWKEQTRSYASLALFTTDRVNLATDGAAERVTGSRVTGEFFQVLGAVPQLGRTIEAADDEQGKGQVVVVSHALWQSRFGSDPGVLGKELLLNARPYRIVGVMGVGFAFPHGTESLDTVGKATDLWVPWAMTPGEKASRADGPGVAIARLRPDVSLSQAQGELSAITARLDPLHPPFLRGSQALVRSFDTTITGASRRALLILMGAVVLVLLIACSNAASLALTRANGRTLEMSVRAALGAPRRRLVRQMMTESLCLAGAAGILGVLAASLAIRLLVYFHPSNIPRLEETSMDWRGLLFAVCASFATAILFGIFPALAASRSNLQEALKKSGDRTVKRAGGRLQRGLMVGQLALTIVLLAGSGLLIRSFLKLRGVDKGFATSSVVTMSVQLDSRYDSVERQNAFFRPLIERTGALPGVELTAAINYGPLGGGQSIGLLTVEGHPFDEKTFFESRSVTPHYFSVMSIPLLQGRAFTDADVAGSQLVGIVSRGFAQKYFFGQNPLGKRFRMRDDNPEPTWCTIVGVAGDVRQAGLETPPPLQIYVPLWQTGADSVVVVVRTSLPADQVGYVVRRVAGDLDTAVAAAGPSTMNQLVSDAAAVRRFQTFLLTAFGSLALFLSLVGLYALISYWVQQRTGEIGIRVALGAEPRRIVQLVLKQGSDLALAGIALGFAGAWSVTRLMAGLLFEVEPADTLTFCAVAVLFSGVAFVACYLPARRATRVDPIVSLRHE
jgi:predicted permease